MKVYNSYPYRNEMEQEKKRAKVHFSDNLINVDYRPIFFDGNVSWVFNCNSINKNQTLIVIRFARILLNALRGTASKLTAHLTINMQSVQWIYIHCFSGWISTFDLTVCIFFVCVSFVFGARINAILVHLFNKINISKMRARTQIYVYICTCRKSNNNNNNNYTEVDTHLCVCLSALCIQECCLHVLCMCAFNK